MPLRIDEAQLYEVQIPFKQPFKHALASREKARNVVVCLKSNEGGVEGYGEAVPREYVTGETFESVWENLQKVWVPSLWEKEWSSPESVSRFLGEWRELIAGNFRVDDYKQLSARAAIELALIDLLGKYFNLNAYKFLNANSFDDPLYYSGVISAESLQKARKKAWLMRWYGFKHVKAKVGFHSDVALIQAVRQALGPKRDLRVDANGAWKAKEAIQKIETLLPMGISAVEQPVGKGDFEGLKEVSDHLPVPIMADESFCSLEDAQRLFQTKGCDILNIRISKCGGLYYSHLAAEMAAKHHFGIQLGCQVGETAILSSAGRIFAQCHPEIKYLEGSYERFLLQKDLSKNRVRFHYKGKAQPIWGVGLGVEIHQKLLESFAVKKVVLKRES